MGKRRSTKKPTNRVGKKTPSAPKAAPAVAAPAEEKQLILDDGTADEHPFKIGHYLVAKYRDDSHRLAKIIEKSGKSGSANGNDWRYYIHYIDFNRRMDEWITNDRIVMLPSEANPMGIKAAAAAAHHHDKKSEHKTDDDAEEDDDEDEGDDDEEEEDDDDDDNAMADDDKDVKLGATSRNEGGPTTVSELEHDEHEGLDEKSLLEHEEITKVKNIMYVLFGKHKIECWYFSPFPKEFHPSGPTDCLYFCEFTFRFFKTKNELVRYQSNPALPRHPPGNEIYRDSKVAMFELDGTVEKIYCQNLCYFAKLFLDHKTLYWDVDPFLFYVLCTHDDRGYHPVGFFSKEKYSDLGYNLACILTFPSSQRQGFGRFLISFSYELSKKEEKVGSPEKPLSDLGAVSYKSYWASTLIQVLRNYPGQSLSITDLTLMTSIISDDIIATLTSLGILQCINGNHIIYAPKDILEELLIKYPSSGLLVDPDQLHWAPLYIVDPKKDKWSLYYVQNN